MKWGIWTWASQSPLLIKKILVPSVFTQFDLRLLYPSHPRPQELQWTLSWRLYTVHCCVCLPITCLFTAGQYCPLTIIWLAVVLLAADVNRSPTVFWRDIIILDRHNYRLATCTAEVLIMAHDWDIHVKLWSDMVITFINCSNFLCHMSYDFNVCVRVCVKALGACFRTEPALKIFPQSSLRLREL